MSLMDRAEEDSPEKNSVDRHSFMFDWEQSLVVVTKMTIMTVTLKVCLWWLK
uniref:Uncharacterized protein n=1 Tax=Arion vulgaris TaxID=1028688 RepID=A0A0B7BW93_9EUPU